MYVKDSELDWDKIINLKLIISLLKKKIPITFLYMY